MRYMKPFLSVTLVFTILMLCVGCGKKNEEPVTVTLWHVYGAQTDSPLNHLIDEFNNSVGEQQNIYVKVTSVTNNKTIYEGVLPQLLTIWECRICLFPVRIISKKAAVQ